MHSGLVILFILAVSGYYYTALQLESRFVLSVTMIFEAVGLYYLLLRWFMVATRRLAMTRAREKRDAALMERNKNKAEEESVEKTHDKLDVPEVTMEEVSRQSNTLLKLLIALQLVVSFVIIWFDVIPAMHIFDNVTLWHYTVTVDGVDSMAAVTLSELFVALFLASLMVVIFKNLPGILELTLFHPLSVSSGNSYAITTICRYGVIFIGSIAVLNLLGINWSKMQWLVAALGLGLGFGLQEIFANFVSGLILLFERPIRVGDTVTVGNISGTVSRIHLRATTIMDWDRKELIVPNKSLITGELINWTLSDRITRITIKIGVAYESDVEFVEKVMKETVETNPAILKEPAPRVLFLGFGENALEFKILVYAKDLGQRLELTHQLHKALNKALHREGIEIPFAQRDIHIKKEIS